jgi:Response regulators consisting of a CheY-like receiver domain and a winged-helix DNA-binding domain
VKLNYLESDEKIILIFKDEGKGISLENQKTLFERFGKSENSSGLGLSFVKELIEMHHGDITVESKLDYGTEFIIKIPIGEKYYTPEEIIDNIQNDDSNTLTIKDSNDKIKNNSEKNIENTILIIDDNDELREYLYTKFRQFYKVYLATNGSEGIDLANKVLPDLIISDVMMPIMDGIEATCKLRDNFNTSHIPIILLTANSSEEKRLEGLEIGADDYINKPFNFNELQLKIKNIIDKRRKLIEKFNREPELSVNILTKSKQDKNFLEKVTLLIQENLGKPIFNIDMLSTEMGCSRTIFYKKMKAITGDTPNVYINTIQMKQAATLLKNTNYSVLDISVMVGFNDKIYFGKNFKQFYGVTPKTYQIQNRGKKI